MFGRLTVISVAGRRYYKSSSDLLWLCKCSCGEEKEVTARSLLRGRTLSCGCYQRDIVQAGSFIDLTGQKFNKLIVLGFSDKTNRQGARYWNCLCDCGNTTIVSTAALLGDYTKSCGCLARDKSALQVDHTGEVYGKLRVVSRDPANSSKWLCECSCGNALSTWISPLLGGRTKSCGCHRKEIKTKHGMSDMADYKVFQSRNHRDKKKIFDASWTLNANIALKEFFLSCVLCGSTEDLDVDHLLPIDLGWGLYNDNVVILCGQCNRKKGNKYISDFPPETRRKLIDASCDFQDYWAKELGEI